MCGRFSFGTLATPLAAQFDLFETPAWTPQYNIPPIQEVLAVLGECTLAGCGKTEGSEAKCFPRAIRHGY